MIDKTEKGKRLKACRQAAGLTQEVLAEIVNVNPKYLSQVESGRRQLSTEAARAIGKALDVRFQYLIGEDDFMTEEAAAREIVQHQSAMRVWLNSLGYDIHARKGSCPAFISEVHSGNRKGAAVYSCDPEDMQYCLDSIISHAEMEIRHLIESRCRPAAAQDLRRLHPEEQCQDSTRT